MFWSAGGISSAVREAEMGDWLEGDSKTSQLVIKYLREKTLDAGEEKARLFTDRGLGWG